MSQPSPNASSSPSPGPVPELVIHDLDRDPGLGLDLDQNVPIPEDLFKLFTEVRNEDAAICHFKELGPKNSRWINDQNERRHTLESLILRIALLEDFARSVIDNVHTGSQLYRRAVTVLEL